jgi:hypothetical protein
MLHLNYSNKYNLYYSTVTYQHGSVDKASDFYSGAVRLESWQKHRLS